MKNVSIVYYGFINPKIKWQNIIYGQLTQLKETMICEVADIYIHLTGDQNNLSLAINGVKKIIPDSIISTSITNQYEYPGIHLLWSLAKENKEHIYLYFHSKGMSHMTNQRALHERKIFKGVIESWKKVLNIFYTYPHINKIGLNASELGWMWFNFWWARGTYLSECEEPIITERRHYYEDWLYRKINGTMKSNVEECYSLSDDKEGIFYSPQQACEKLGLIKI